MSADHPEKHAELAHRYITYSTVLGVKNVLTQVNLALAQTPDMSMASCSHRGECSSIAGSGVLLPASYTGLAQPGLTCIAAV